MQTNIAYIHFHLRRRLNMLVLNTICGRRRNHFPFYVCLAQNWIGQRDSLAADVCKKLLTALVNCSQNLLTENQFCSWRINFAHGESWIALHSTCNLSMDAWHNYYLHTNCSKRRKFAHSKKNCSRKSNLPRARICSKNLLTAEICSQNLVAA
jgi:hypothetical protein